MPRWIERDHQLPVTSLTFSASARCLVDSEEHEGCRSESITRFPDLVLPKCGVDDYLTGSCPDLRCS